MLNVQKRKRKGLAQNLPGDYITFPGGEQASIFIPTSLATVS